MAISRASIRNRTIPAMPVFKCAVRAVLMASTVGMAASSSAIAAPLPASYAAACEKSAEFTFAQKALIQGRREAAAGHYSAASKILEQGITKLDDYQLERSSAAGFPVLDDTGQHLSLTYFLELHRNIKKSVYLKTKYLKDTIAECEREPKTIRAKLRKLSGH
jgi:hypothetical protein